MENKLEIVDKEFTKQLNILKDNLSKARKSEAFKDFEGFMGPNENYIKEVEINKNLYIKSLFDVESNYEETLNEAVKFLEFHIDQMGELNQFFEEARKRGEIKETSSTGGGGSFTPGEGEQYATKFAFKKPVYKYKLAKKQTNETKSNDETFVNSLNITDPALKLHVEKRLQGFDDVETKLNELIPLLKQAKQKTLEIYQKNPNFNVIYSTDIAADYLQDIITLFKD